MSQEEPPACVGEAEPRAPAAPEKTSDYYCVSERLPRRFNHPGWFRGYRSAQAASVYRTSNQVYGSRAPTVHEMPKVFYPYSSKFSREFAVGGMFQSSAFNVGLEKSVVTGPDNHVTACDRLNFHPSYNASRPSICD
ncbi:piercer of microtubule wall 1 protein isoform X1 [Lepus europaeus]|uniref:piercer of microtubule wall 1 protein isoform X1 n=1 Tax=Lepus europaeus TaxID=9983 RepID=UPI002B469B6C|nr:piercer of microtubule wall 1 protein isoform X1 [Lepus europaeus]